MLPWSFLSQSFFNPPQTFSQQEVLQPNAKLSLGKQDSGNTMRAALALLARAAEQCESLFNGMEHERAMLLQSDDKKARLSWEVCSIV